MTAFLTIFLSVLLAELGDKTQLATILFATDGEGSRWLVIGAASTALVASTVLAVLLGAAAERWLTMVPLKLVAGIGFIVIGGWMVVGHVQSG